MTQESQTIVVPKMLVEAAKLAANTHKVKAALVCAIVEQESTWEPHCFNPEPRYKYLWDIAKNEPFRAMTAQERNAAVPPKDFPCTRAEDRDAEWWGQKMSWGLMQVMGAVARELQLKGWLSKLVEPEVGLDYGCAYLARKLASKNNDVRQALQSWNGGSNPNYADEVMARIARYSEAK